MCVHSSLALTLSPNHLAKKLLQTTNLLYIFYCHIQQGMNGHEWL